MRTRNAMIRLSLFAGLMFAGGLGIAREAVLPAQAVVWRVIDGDSLKLDSDLKVRMIGIDTPEATINRKLFNEARERNRKMAQLKAAGRQAAAFTRRLVEGRQVRLEFDERVYDKYGKLLAYVFLEDGTFVNAELVKQGYAIVMPSGPNVKYEKMLAGLQEQARKQKRGFWADPIWEPARQS